MFPPGTPESVGMRKDLTSALIDEWLKDDVFRAKWWILLGLNILALLAWLLLLDKTKLKRTFLFVALAAIFALGLDEIGQELVLWDFPVDIIPIFPPLTSFNLMIMPLAFSLVFQFTRTTKHYFLFVLVVSAVLCFIVEPLLSWGGF